MGVRGLTSYIARHAEWYLQPFELHDTDLVIDGDNLACLLYKDVSGCNSAFGGDYDEYYRTVVCFFHLLFECKVRPFVLMDGGYERKKMRTVEKRLRGKICVVKHLNPNMSKPLFPLMMKEVFIDAVRDCGLKVMRCTFEADDELAVLARKLNCPLLSYDSDFYIHNVQYIPAISMSMKVQVKKEKDLLKNTHLRQCQARRFQKTTQANKGKKILPEDSGKTNKKGQANVKFIDCCIYRIENLLAGTKLKREMLPIFAALLGNDYISSYAFKQFHIHVGKKGPKSPLHRRIKATILWLRNESKQSAIEKIFGRMKKEEREPLLAQMEAAISGYSNEVSDAYEYFGLHLEERENTEEDYSETSDEEIEEEELSESELDLSEVNTTEDAEADVEDISEEKSDELTEDELESENELIEEIEVEDETTENEVEVVTEFPEWLCDRIRSADLPRFCVDLAHQNLYINNPQVENFLLPDCNMIALPIIRHIFSLIKYQYPEKPKLRYLSRVIKKTNVLYSRLDVLDTIPPFDPTEKSLDALKNVFSRLPLSTDKLFTDLNSIPSFLQLYVLAIVYWANKTAHGDEIHLRSLILCLVVVSTIDAKIVPIRDVDLFNKKYGQTIRKERMRQAILTASKINHQSTKGTVPTPAELKADKIEKLMNSMSPEKRIQYASKTECILVQECLLRYFQQPTFHHKHHDEFSSSVVHGFSEFQSVIYQLYTLNKIVNEPLESIRMARVYSGVFLYNLYTSFRIRLDVEYYVEKFLLKDSPIMFAFYTYLQDWLKPFVPLLKTDKPRRRKTRKHKSNENKSVAKEPDNTFALLEEQI